MDLVAQKDLPKKEIPKHQQNLFTLSPTILL